MKMTTSRIIGSMRNLVLIQTPHLVQADDGSYGAAPWDDVGYAMAYVRPVTATEYNMAQQIVSEQTHVVTIRYMAGLTSSMRLVYTPDGQTSRYLYIVTPPRDIDERHQFLELRCRERES